MTKTIDTVLIEATSTRSSSGKDLTVNKIKAEQSSVCPARFSIDQIIVIVGNEMN